jgi:hypothetical protein
MIDSGTIDSTFPMLNAVKPFFGEDRTCPQITTPGWANGSDFTRQVLEMVDLPVRALALAGYRVATVTFSAHAPPSGPSEWLVIDMTLRSAVLSTESGASHVPGAGATLRLLLAEHRGDEGSHALAITPPAGAAWSVVGGMFEASATGAGYDLLKSALTVTLSTAAAHIIMAACAAPFATREGGLGWLLNPENWYADGAGPPPGDDFMGQIAAWAEDIWDSIQTDEEERRRAVFAMLMGNATMETMLLQFSRTAKTNTMYAALGIEQEEPDTSLPTPFGVPSPLDDAFGKTPYLDFIGMLVNRGRISPPLLDGGYWSLPEPPAEPLHVKVLSMAGSRVTALEVLLFGQPALIIRQAEVVRDPSLTPDIMDNLAWEYLGEQSDGSHAIALTAGRGVSVTRVPDLVWTLHIDLFHVQRAADIGRGLSRPAERNPVFVPFDDLYPPTGSDEDLDDEETDSDGVDGSPVNRNGYMRSEDITATAPPRTRHDELRMPRFSEPAIPLPSAADELSNFEWEHPPTLITTWLETGGVRLDWFRIRPGRPQSDQAPPPQPPDYSITITPKNRFDGTFGLSHSIDYGVLGHRPVNEDLAIELAAQGVLTSLSTVFLPAFAFMIQRYYGVQTEALQPFGIGYLRIWYAGEIDVEIHRVMNSDEDLRVEIVRVADVMDLPEQGTRLPCRHARFEDVGMVPGNAFIMALGALVGVWLNGSPTYDTMLEPDLTPIPLWDDPGAMPAHLWGMDGPDIDRIEHVIPAEPYLANMAGPSLPQYQGWADVRRFIVAEDNTELWLLGGVSDANLITGVLDVTPTWHWTVVTIGFDVGTGMIPVYGDYLDAAEFYYVVVTGKDKWGQPVPFWAKCLMAITTLVPFVSNGWVKGARFTGETAAAGVGIGAVVTVAQGGQSGNSGITPLGRLFSALAAEVPDFFKVRQLDAAMAAESRAYAAMTRAERRQVLETVLNMEELGNAAVRVGSALVDGAAGLAFKFQDLLDDTGKFVSPGMEDSYLAWSKATTVDPATRWAFLQSRKYVAPGVNREGIWRVLADTFGLIDYAPRVTYGKPQPGSRWPYLVGLVPGRWGIRPLDAVAQTLGQTGAVGKARLAIAVAGAQSQSWVTKYEEPLEVFLAACRRRSVGIAGLFSDRTVLSHENDAMMFMAHIMEMFDDQHLQAAEALGRAGLSLADFVAIGRRIEAGTATAADTAKFDLMMDSMFDTMKKGMTKAEHYHGYAFEYRVGVILTEIMEHVAVIGVRAQALIDGKSGPDFCVFMSDGFAIVQCKAHQLARDLLGIGAAQANLSQIVTDMVRLSKKNGAVELADEVVGGTNRFNGRYISSLDDDYLLANGQIDAEVLWDIGPGNMRVALSDLGGLPDEAMDRIRAGASNPSASSGDLVFDTLDGFRLALPYLGSTAEEALLAAARTRQADDMGQIIEDMRSLTSLQTALTSGPNAERWAKTLAAFIRSKESPPTTVFTDLMGPDGARKVFDHFEIADGWLDFLPNDTLRISVLSQTELAGTAATDFRGVAAP